jgi:hypothetical protein
MLDQTIEDVTKALAAIRDGVPYSTSDVYAGTLLILVENDDYAPDNGLDPYLGFEVPVRQTAKGAGLEQMPLDKFFAEYLVPHAAQADFEGDYVKALVLREAIRRLEEQR